MQSRWDAPPVRVLARRYAFGDVLGRGGMGTVWRSEDVLLRRVVAVKEVVMPPTVSREDCEKLRRRVLHEARTAARLDHPGAVTVYDVLEEDGKTYIVMEYVRAPSLEEHVRQKGSLTPRVAARIGHSVLEVLMAAHRAGVVHRDVKPGNVLVRDDGSVKLTDFGIASLVDDPSVTTSGLTFGSPLYMAPEQVRGERSTPATDLWGLGATLYYAVEERPPFERGEALATLTSILNDPTPPPRRAGALEPLLLRLLAKPVADRPADAEALEELEAVAEGRRDQALTRPVLQAVTDAGLLEPPAPDVAEEPPTAVVPAVEDEPAWALADPAAAIRPPPQQPHLGDAADVDGSAVAGEPAVEPLARATEDERRRRTWAIAGIVGLLAVVVLAIGGLLWFATSSGTGVPTAATSPRARAPSAPARSSPVRGSTSPRASSASHAPPSSSAPATSGGLVAYTDPVNGYSLKYPAGWQVLRRTSTTTDFRDPSTGAYLRVEWTSTPGSDPQAAWESYSKEFASTHSNYSQIRITPLTYEGHPASLWEFTYSENGGDLHAADLGFVTPSDGYALYFQSPSSQWDRYRSTFASYREDFRLP